MKELKLTQLGVLILLTLTSNAQQFTKVMNGSIVNTTSGSRSCNFIDVNNDGYQDVLITNGKTGGENNLMYINNGNETFNLMNGDPIVSDGTPSDGASCADYDNDGNTDVFIVNWYNIDNLLYQNGGANSFTKIDTGIIVNDNGSSETAAWGDADQDGLVDLYVTNSAGSNRNFLYRNLGSGHFQKISNIAPVTDNSLSRCVNWIDYDNDGDADIFVTNENGQANNLYQNDGNFTFTKLIGNTLTTDNLNSMSASWEDYDNDGDFDVFIANYQQNNQLFQNDGSGSFSSVSGPWDTEIGCSFSSSFTDYDNDGDLDLFVTNGFCSNDLKNYFYTNNGNGTFTKNSTEPLAIDSGGSYGCAWGDYNNDGFMDLVVANWQNETQTNYLYKNEGNSNNWVELRLEGTVSNRSAIGTIVKCKSTINGLPVWQTRLLSSQSGYCSQNSMVVHFGLAEDTLIDSLQIIWPSGIIENFDSVISNTIHFYKEPEPIASTPINLKQSLIKLYPNPSKGSIKIEILEEMEDSFYFEIFTLTGKKILDGEFKINSNSQIYTIQDLLPGTYLVNITSKNDKRTYSDKLIVE